MSGTRPPLHASAPPTCRARASPAGWPATSGSRLPPRWRRHRCPRAAEPFTVTAQGAAGARTRLRRGTHGLPGPRLGRPAAASSPRSSSRWSPPGTGSSCSTRPRTATPTRAGRAAAGPTASSSARRWTPCSPGSDPPRPWSRTRSAPSRRTSPCASAGSAPSGWCCVAPMVEAQSLFDQFQAALGLRRPDPARVRPRGRRFVGIPVAEFDAIVQAAHVDPCRPWSCTTAATGRRRTPTPSGWSPRSPTPAGHHRGPRPPADPARPRRGRRGRRVRAQRRARRGRLTGQPVRWCT